MNKKEQPELSYYGLYLLRYLLEQHSRKAKDLGFIYSREQLAAVIKYAISAYFSKKLSNFAPKE